MGTIESDHLNSQLVISSTIITYGNAADPAITELIRDEIESMWNEPEAKLLFRDKWVRIVFRITAAFEPQISATEIYQNLDPVKNYFRIEEFVRGNISFVDGLGCNTGYFKLDNLYKGSTTAAHEYGHTLGLNHPDNLDIRGQGVPGIMYPRGTLVDAQFQYNPEGLAGDSSNGGTMHPKYRKVRPSDIELLKLNKLNFVGGKAILGQFSSVWHDDHSTIR